MMHYTEEPQGPEYMCGWAVQATLILGKVRLIGAVGGNKIADVPSQSAFRFRPLSA
jgi:hypothetical protein